MILKDEKKENLRFCYFKKSGRALKIKILSLGFPGKQG